MPHPLYLLADSAHNKSCHMSGKLTCLVYIDDPVSIICANAMLFVSCSPKHAICMKGLLLNAFYDSVQYDIGWIVTYVFIFLMVIELAYVMAKYLGSRTDK